MPGAFMKGGEGLIGNHQDLTPALAVARLRGICLETIKTPAQMDCLFINVGNVYTSATDRNETFSQVVDF